jgi:hypothetical protein
MSKYIVEVGGREFATYDSDTHGDTAFDDAVAHGKALARHYPGHEIKINDGIDCKTYTVIQSGEHFQSED